MYCCLRASRSVPQKTLRIICNEVDKLIQRGKRKQPNNLIDFLKESANFNGVGKFDPHEVLSLHFDQETPNCFAISLNIVDDNKRVNHFLSAVGEGLYFAKLIERTLDKNGDLTSILHAADVVWVGVEFSKKWLDNDREREESIREAAVLLGQSEGILEIPPPRDLPSLDPIKAAYIQECWATMALNRAGIDVFIE
ncbi:hypothetical protein ABFX02_09G045400 [Erythranthe guttata]